ncbi:MAG: TGS domain-containing protein [Thaumarchaeota archaeon]|nr:TGS domain-containing protein [Nitrososphaerota archaeon]
MPTNLPERAKAKWAEAIAAKDPAQKLKLLKEFYSSFPKHKGTEKLEMSIKRQIAALEEELERARLRRRTTTRSEWVIKKEGALQAAVMGSVETSLDFFNTISKQNAKLHEALASPLVGALRGAGLTLQLVLTPFDRRLGDEKQERFLSVARNSDVILTPLKDEGVEYIRELVEWFEEHNIEVKKPKLDVEIKQTPSGGIRVVGSSNYLSEREAVDFLKSYMIRNAIVEVSRNATLDDLEAVIFGREAKNLQFIPLTTAAMDTVRGMGFSNIICVEHLDQDELVEQILSKLGKIRVYTKAPNSQPVDKPILLDGGATVIDLAAKIHKDFLKFFSFARLWRRGLPEGVKVGRNFRLMDGDVVELHTS